MKKTPLNQIYRSKITFDQYPEVYNTFEEITNLALEKDFVNLVDGHKYPKGRRYDYALLFNNNVDFTDKLVCDLGARDGFFGSYVTKYAKKVHISDYFECWGKGTENDLGDFNSWKDIWEKCAVNPDRLVVEHQDITKLDYPDNHFDIVMCTSVIEHLFNQNGWLGDMTGLREIVRITKPGGNILLSTDIAEKTKWISGTLYYSKTDLFDRLIIPSKCYINGPYDFDLDHPDNTDIHEIKNSELKKASSVVFSLIKPLHYDKISSY